MSIEWQGTKTICADEHYWECRVYFSGADGDQPIDVDQLPTATWNSGGVTVEPRLFSYTLFGQRYKSLAYIKFSLTATGGA